jgi:hypothetical protein
MRDKQCLLAQLIVLLAPCDRNRLGLFIATAGRARRSQTGVQQTWTRFLCSLSQISLQGERESVGEVKKSKVKSSH